MNYEETKDFYGSQYKRLKLTDDEFDTMISNLNDNTSDEVKMTLYHNVVLLSFPIIFKMFSARLQQLDSVMDDFLTQTFLTFNSCITNYKPEHASFKTYFFSAIRKDLNRYYVKYHSKANLTMPEGVYYSVKNDITSDWKKSAAETTNVDYIDNYNLTDGSNYIYDTIGDDKQPEVNEEWIKNIKPLILSLSPSLLLKNNIHIYEDSFGLIDGVIKSHITTATKYNVSKQYIGNIILRITAELQQLAKNNNNLKESLINLC